MGFLSKLTGADAAKDAAKAAELGQAQAGALWSEFGNQSQLNLEPYGELGKLGVNAITNAYNDPSSFRADPGYQFAFDEGQRAVESSGAARGLNLSGAQLKALNKYGTGVADQTYGNWFNRNMGLANYGANIANSQNNALSTATQGQANAATGAANAKASGYLAKGGITNSLFNTALGAGIGYATGNPFAGFAGSSVGGGTSYTNPGATSGYTGSLGQFNPFGY
jgi:hypothetical protein